MTEYALAPSRKFTATSPNIPSAMLEQGLLAAYRVRSNGTTRHLDLCPLGSTLRDAAEWVSEAIEMDSRSVQSVARELHVSPATVRRYLESLELTEEVEAGEWDDLIFDSAGNPVWSQASEEDDEETVRGAIAQGDPVALTCTCAADLLDQAVHEPACAKYVAPRASVRKCTVCSKVVTDRNSASKQYRALGFKDMCVACYDASGLENEHSDGHHVDDPNPECSQCKDRDLLARNRARFTSTPQPTDAERAAALADVPGAQCEPVGTPADEVEAALAASVAQATGAPLAVCFCGDQGAHAPGVTGCKNAPAPVRRVRSHA
jgi:predicted transcriptional regulator